LIIFCSLTFFSTVSTIFSISSNFFSLIIGLTSLALSITLTDLKIGTEVRFYTSDLSLELYGVESSTTSVSYTYTQLRYDVVVVIYNIDYEPIRLTIDLADVDSIIPIQQQTDRWVLNP
jgi:hypothetical protein